MRITLFVLGLSVAILMNSGCSMIGLMIGANADRKNAKNTEVTNSLGSLYQDENGVTAIPIEPGTDLRVIHQNGTVYEGKFSGIETIDEMPNLVVRRVSDKVFIPVTLASKVEIKQLGSNGAATGFLVGAMIDAAVIFLLVNSIGSMSFGGY